MAGSALFLCCAQASERTGEEREREREERERGRREREREREGAR